jgi:hypothetical protein
MQLIVQPIYAYARVMQLSRSIYQALQEETATPTATGRRVSLKMPSGQPNPTAFS